MSKANDLGLFFRSFIITSIWILSSIQILSAQEKSIGKSKVKQVVIDTDTYNEIDDQFALVYALLSSASIKVNAIYAAPFDNKLSTGPADGMQKSYEEINRVLDRLNAGRQYNVFKGSASFLPQKNIPVQSEAAADLVKRALAVTDTLYVLALGAPTNVASAILIEPEIINKIKVIWLGGRGLSWNTAYEFNLKQDVWASQLLFDSKVDLVQIPTQPVSSHLTTTLPELEKHLKGKNKIADYLLEIFANHSKDHFAWSKVIWDIAVIAYVINESWIPTEVRSAPILTNELTYSFDNRRKIYKVAYYADRNRIFRDLFTKISKVKD